jgi:rhodanese-related sulfurtransferase
MIKLMWRGALIVIVSAVLGVCVNAVSPGGVPLFGAVPPVDMNGLESVEAEEALRLFKEKQVVFVDARSEEEFCEGHIPGAKLLTQDDFEDNISTFKQMVPADTPLVTYCSGEGCGSSMEVAGLLKDEGYENTKIFLGGWEKWKLKGCPVAERER